MSKLIPVPDEGETLGDLIDRMYYNNAEQAKQIAELEKEIAELEDARKMDRLVHKAENKRLRELIIHYRIMDKDEIDAALAAIGEER